MQCCYSVTAMVTTLQLTALKQNILQHEYNHDDDDVNILFQIKQDTLMIGHCTAQAVIATKTFAGKKYTETTNKG